MFDCEDCVEVSSMKNGLLSLKPGSVKVERLRLAKMPFCVLSVHVLPMSPRVAILTKTCSNPGL